MLKNKTLTDVDIIKETSKQTGLSQKHIREILTHYFDNINNHLELGSRVRVGHLIYLQLAEGKRGYHIKSKKTNNLLNIAKRMNKGLK